MLQHPPAKTYDRVQDKTKANYHTVISIDVGKSLDQIQQVRSSEGQGES